MKKLGLVLGAAAVAAIAGCKDPNYPSHRNAQNEPQPVETTPVEPVKTQAVPVVAPEKDIDIVPEVQHCKCPAGTVHKELCGCGAPDCQCIVEVPAPISMPVVTPAEETTPYIVQRGDYLAKISKKYNITIAAIKRVNPNMKGDTVRVGQTIQLPGKVNVGEQTKPTVAPVAPKKAYVPYTGATKDYTIKNGDSLGAIAKKNGISVRQLKELNGLQSDVIRIGKTLKVPAEKVAAPAPVVVKAEPKVAAPKTADAKPVAVPKVESKVVVPAADDKPMVVEDAASVVVPETPVVEPAVQEAASKAEEGPTHVVREGEDLTSLSILYSLSPAEIRSFNNLGENDELKPGQVIKLPADTQL